MNRNKKIWIFIFLAIIILIFFLRDPYNIDAKSLASPSFKHIFGTDNLGRDIFTRLVLGTVITIVIVFVSMFSATVVGNIIGFLSGYYGGIIDHIFQTLVEVILSIPAVLIAVAVVVILGPGFISLTFAMFLMYLPLVINYARGLAISEKDKGYVLAAKTYGVKNLRIILKHIFPNIKIYILINFGINFSRGILTEAGLGFLGIGLDPSIPTLGNMLNASQSYFVIAPWFTIFPGVAIIILVYYVNKISKSKGAKLHGRKVKN